MLVKKISIESIALKFYKGCIFHNGRKTYGRFRRKGDEDWEDLCKECYDKMSQNSQFLKEHELERVLGEWKAPAFWGLSLRGR